ncbi:MAG: hypothetical protein JW876_02325 [Candidatus Krumholzibacteriota bacterium]|nr:hypothetical protein [Candidatus Krumholzibacteriota bacterium]
MKCIDPESIEEVLALPPDSPRRRHLEECPRCSSMLLLYRSFMAGEAAAGSDPIDADARLEAFMRDATAAGTDPGGREQRSRPARLAGILVSRPVLATAASVLIVAAVLWWSPWTDRAPVLRGEGEAPPASRPVSLLAPRTVDDGAVMLSWRSLDGADAYLVRVRNADLEEIAGFGPSPDTVLVLQRSMLPAGTAATVFWRVIALTRGDETGRSAPASIDLPVADGE